MKIKMIVISILITFGVIGILNGCNNSSNTNVATNSENKVDSPENKDADEIYDNAEEKIDNSNKISEITKEKETAKNSTSKSNIKKTSESATNKSDVKEASKNSTNKLEIYEVSNKIYTKNSVKINYPQITNLNDSKKCDLINKILKDEALAVINYYDVSNLNTILNVSYKIQLQNNDNLSIVYTGDFNRSDSAYPISVFYTSNIDIKDGKSIRLKDYANISEVFNKLRNSNEFSGLANTQDLANAQKEYLLNMDNSTLKDMLINTDFYKENGNIQFPESFSYRKDDNIIISISVPHAIGDHAEFELKK